MDRTAMIAQAEVALRTCWAQLGAPDAEACGAVREALAIYDAPCLSWQQLVDEALDTLGIHVDWRPGGVVYGFSYRGDVQPWGEHAIDAVWPVAAVQAA